MSSPIEFSVRKAVAGSALCGLALVLALFTGCATQRGGQASSASGEKLWSQNCRRCHNQFSPDTFSPSQWDVVATHMRVRANLTATEHEKILKFLQGAE